MSHSPFFLNVSLNLLNSVMTVKGLKPATKPPLVLETRILQQHQQNTCER